MSAVVTYGMLAAVLWVAERLYFKLAEHYNIVSRPTERGSHTGNVIRGGGVIFTFSICLWILEQRLTGQGGLVREYLPFFAGLLLIAGISFWDDVRSLPDGVRLLVQFVAMALMLGSLRGLWLADLAWYWQLPLVLLALVVLVGAANVVNFMDGINGITAGYALAVLLPIGLLNAAEPFVEPSFLLFTLISVLVFSCFNFRPKGKAKCFAGDVGSIGLAFILLFAIARLIMKTGDVTWLALLLVYGVDGCCTIVHRMLLHENLGQVHRKHAYQLLANELGLSHVTVSLLYAALQLAISLIMIYFVPVQWHWPYLVAVLLLLGAAYLLFMKKYYHLHEEYLESVKEHHTCQK